MKERTHLEDLRALIEQLRDPETGCPWDLEQTHESLKPYIIEEAYEVLEAIDLNREYLCEELGDVLLQIMLHSQLASERGEFSIYDVVEAIKDKIIKRHPHIFADVTVKDSKEVTKNWEEIKRREMGSDTSVLGSVPRHLPGLLKAQRMGEKASRVGFDWPDADSVKEKVEEELREFISASSEQELTEEFGDMLFALAQLGRKLGIDVEDSLQRACRKFAGRFKKMESKAGSRLKEMGLSELESLWKQAK